MGIRRHFIVNRLKTSGVCEIIRIQTLIEILSTNQLFWSSPGSWGTVTLYTLTEYSIQSGTIKSLSGGVLIVIDLRIVCLFVWFDSLHPINNLSVIKGQVFLGWTSTKLGLMFLLKDTTQWRWWGSNMLPFGLESSAQYHWATVLPLKIEGVASLRHTRGTVLCS